MDADHNHQRGRTSFFQPSLWQNNSLHPLLRLRMRLSGCSLLLYCLCGINGTNGFSTTRTCRSTRRI
jgi:hypothetical protein